MHATECTRAEPYSRGIDGPASKSASGELLLVLVLSALFFLPGIPSRDLWNPDEPRYMEVAREMVMLHDYVVPRLNGEPYPDKPPMFFWLAAGLYRLGCGVNSGRFLAAMASMGTLLLTYILARRYSGGRAALFAALSILTAFLFAATSRIGVIDPVLTFFTTGAIFCGLTAMDAGSKRRWAWWLAAYALAACGVLTKGPVGLVVPAIVLTACGLALRGRLSPGGWIHAAGAGLLVGLVLAWLVPAAMRGGPDYARTLILQVRGYAAGSASHHNPFYYYLLLAPLILLPWTFFIVPAFYSAGLAWRRSRDAAAVVGLAWFGAVFVFFSLMSSKRVGYIMPLMPAFGLLMGRYFEESCRNEHPWPRVHDLLARALIGVMGALLGLCILAAPATRAIIGALPLHDATLVKELRDAAGGVWLPLIIGSGAALAWLLVSWRRRRTRSLFAVIVGALLAVSLTMDIVLVPRANRFKSGRNFVLKAKDAIRQAEQVCLYRKDFDGVYNIYTGVVSFPVLLEPQDLKAAMARAQRVAVIGRDTEIGDVLGMPPRVGRIAAMSRVGHRNIVLLVNWPEGQREAERNDEATRPSHPETGDTERRRRP